MTAVQPTYLRVKNWDEFQHYKDRRPPWIKLHVALADDYAFQALSDAAKFHLVGAWLLAAKTDNKIPNDPGWIATRIGARSKVDVAELIEAGFLVPWKQAAGGQAKWPSRYISAELRALILSRDLHQCRTCSSTEKLEIDHIVPVSRGGTSTADNLQVLCRPCNRAKRAKIRAEEVATQKRSEPLRSDRASVLPRQRRGESEKTRADAQGQKPFRCDVTSCGIAFATAEKLADHLANVHGRGHLEVVA